MSSVMTTATTAGADDPRQWNCDDLDYCADRLGFDAIQWLHHKLDDDHSGYVDITESDDFLRDELNYQDVNERQKAFHGNDKHITVDELWKAWRLSDVRNWTVDQTVDWLCDVVELPQYATQFYSSAVDGLALPRLAANTQYITILGITNPIHKQKLALKAMDVVLFGSPRHHSLVKDILVVLSLMIAVGGVWMALAQYKWSQQNLKKMMADMDSLQRAEEQLSGMQKELDRTRQEQQLVFNEKISLEKRLRENESQMERSASYNQLSDVCRIAELEDELSRCREELRRLLSMSSSSAAGKWTSSSSSTGPPAGLQLWLQLTHELEIRSFNSKRLSAELQLFAAKEGCEKLRKKRSTLLGAFRVAHGNSIDEIDNRILEAKTALKEVTKELKERLKRWHQIERLCGFSIVNNAGQAFLEHTLYGSPVSSPTGSVATLSSSTTTATTPLGRTSSETTIVDTDSLLSIPAATASAAAADTSYAISRSVSTSMRSKTTPTTDDISGRGGDDSDDVIQSLKISDNKRSMRLMVKSYSEDASSLSSTLYENNTNCFHNNNNTNNNGLSMKTPTTSNSSTSSGSSSSSRPTICHSESCNQLKQLVDEQQEDDDDFDIKEVITRRRTITSSTINPEEEEEEDGEEVDNNPNNSYINKINGKTKHNNISYDEELDTISTTDSSSVSDLLAKGVVNMSSSLSSSTMTSSDHKKRHHFFGLRKRKSTKHS
ncbi:stromal interaction molecule homolog [Oppia nitens]|uniref:stromal interaction molecule homolog n=1 Tax=Oppia nitens TaxID=1686743 RepID=UPI0023D9F29A|nr:stromal interaction molecule homolog [Oppia nitens]